jgi:hypothetical protein
MALHRGWRFLVVLSTLSLVVASVALFGPLRATSRAAGGFSPNQELPLPLTAGSLPVRLIVRGLEPSTRVAQDGAVYVSSIRGVPGGVDLHRYYAPADGPTNADGTYPFKYEGRPDGCGILATGCDLIGIAEGGGDVDLAVNYPPAGVPNLALASLTLAPGITANHSIDRGDHFTQPNPVAATIPGDDRQWLDGTDASTVYLSYHDVATFNINVNRSIDGGQTYQAGLGEAIDPTTLPAAGGIPATNTGSVHGSIRVDRSSCPSRGNLYQIFVAPDTAAENITGQPPRTVYVGVSTDVKLGLPVFTFKDHKVFTGAPGANFAQIFPALAIDALGNLYAVWSDNSNIFYSFSTDLGNTWKPGIRLNAGGTIGKANVFPWIDADANGHIGVVWFGGDRAGNSNDASIHEPTNDMRNWTNWNVYFSESLNGDAVTPFFSQAIISDHVIHRGTVSTGGLGGGANRNLGDYFQIAFDPSHRANVAFSDDHSVNPLGPNNGPDNPSTRRLIRANFTHQLARPDVVTEGLCAGTGVRPPEAEGDQGQDQDDNEDVAFVDRHDPNDGSENGALVFHDRVTGLAIQSVGGVRSISYAGRCVSFIADARVNGRLGYGLSFAGCDNANPGAGVDTYTLDATGPGGFTFHIARTVRSGDIKLHTP